MASKHSENYMKWSARIGAAIWFVILVVCLFLAFKTPAVAGVPEQAQASTLAVPGQPAELPYAGAIVVVQCKLVVAVIMIRHDGTQEQLDLHNFTPPMISTKLMQAPLDNATEVEVNCPVVKGAGSV